MPTSFTSQSLHPSAAATLAQLALELGLPIRVVLAGIVEAAATENHEALRARMAPHIEALFPKRPSRSFTDDQRALGRGAQGSLRIAPAAPYAPTSLWKQFCRLGDMGMEKAFAQKLTAQHAETPLRGDDLADARKVWRNVSVECRPPEFQ